VARPRWLRFGAIARFTRHEPCVRPLTLQIDRELASVLPREAYELSLSRGGWIIWIEHRGTNMSAMTSSRARPRSAGC
jgi:hypothetical protein